MPKKRKLAAPPPGATRSIDIHLRSSRNPPLAFTLSNASVTSLSIDDLKTEVQSRVEATTAGNGRQIPLQKIKILYKLKPVQAKTVSEVLGEDDDVLRRGGKIEFGFMIIGGAKVASTPPSAIDDGNTVASKEEKKEGDKPTATSGGAEPDTGAGAGTAKSPDAPMADLSLGALPSEIGTMDDLPVTFWPDLDQFLQTKLKSPTQAARLGELFKKVFENRHA